MKTITLHSLSKPDDPELGYHDYITVDDEKTLGIWGSHASCCPNPYKVNGQGKPIPWKLLYDWIAYGEYKWECVDHYKYGKCLLINGGGEVASRNPVKNKDGSTFKGVFVHTGAFKSKNPKWRGSQGCITIPPDQWTGFMELFTVGEKGELHVKPLIEDLI